MARVPALFAAAAAALVLPAAPAAAQQTAEVAVVDVAFEPAEVTVDAGGTVTWTQTGSLPHTVTADDGSFDSHPDCSGGTDCMANGDTFTQTFSEPGTFPYYCRIHGGPGGVGMAGVVVVTEAGATETPTATETTTPTPTPTDDGGGTATVSGSIQVADQSGDGSSITVDSVTITGAAGFVVVHQDEDGAPGAVLGHVAIPEGTSTGVVVPLDEPLTSDVTVWPMLHVDAGTPGTYEFPGADGPVTVDGEVVMAPVDVTLAAAGDQETPVEDPDLPRTGVAPLVVLVLAGALVLGGVTLVSRARRTRRAA